VDRVACHLLFAFPLVLLLQFRVLFLSAQVGQLEAALQAFQKHLVTRGESNEIKTFVSTNVTESLRSIVPPDEFPDGSEAGAISKLLETLPPQSFMVVLKLLNDALLGLLKRSQAIHELIERVLDVVETATATSMDPACAGVVDRLRAVNSGVVAVVTTRVQNHVSKLVAVRASLHARLKVEEFVQMYAAVGAFASAADGCAEISGSVPSTPGAVSPLRSEMATQVRALSMYSKVFVVPPVHLIHTLRDCRPGEGAVAHSAPEASRIPCETAGHGTVEAS
jgi:hypothetical protein